MFITGPIGNKNNNECNMREIKSGLGGARKQHDIVVLQNIPHHHSLVKANRILLLLASTLMVVVFVLSFLLFPAADVLDSFEDKKQYSAVNTASVMQDTVLSAEINALKSQFVGLISGSIESKLRALEESVRTGRLTASLGTIQDLKNDVKVLQSYSIPVKKNADLLVNEALSKEVSQLKDLIYLTLTSCGLMIAAIGGFWVRNHFRLSNPRSNKVSALGGRRE